MTNNGNYLVSGGIINRPHAIAVDLNNEYIANTNNNNIIKRSISTTQEFGNNGVLNMPMGITLDGSGHIFIADTGNQAIKRMTTVGSDVTTIATGFLYPTGVLVDSSGRIYVADRGTNNNGKIVVLNSSGTVISNITTGVLMPYSMTFDSNGDVLFTDVGDKKIKKLSVASLSSKEFSTNDLIVYPNPTTDFIQIENQNNLQISSIKIFDLNGRELLNNNEKTNHKIDVSFLSKGIYMLAIKTEKGIKNIKFIKN